MHGAGAACVRSVRTCSRVARVARNSLPEIILTMQSNFKILRRAATCGVVFPPVAPWGLTSLPRQLNSGLPPDVLETVTDGPTKRTTTSCRVSARSDGARGMGKLKLVPQGRGAARQLPCLRAVVLSEQLRAFPRKTCHADRVAGALHRERLGRWRRRGLRMSSATGTRTRAV